MTGHLPSFFRVPPFPGSHPVSFLGPGEAFDGLPDADIDGFLAAIASAKVGSAYWGGRPRLPDAPYTLLRVRDCGSRSQLLRELAARQETCCWTDADWLVNPMEVCAVHSVSGTCDPWHMVAGAQDVITDANDELAMVAALAGKKVRTVGDGPFRPLSDIHAQGQVTRELFRRLYLERCRYFDPFTRDEIGIHTVIETCSFWRNLIESNQDISAAVGFARWKRRTVAPLLWGGVAEVAFVSDGAGLGPHDQVAVWKSRVSADTLNSLKTDHVPLIEVEDGFIRSAGLGADCVPPLSIVVDRLAAHYNPAQPSELENLLEASEISEKFLDRARRIRELIVATGVGKYGKGVGQTTRRNADRPHVLVTGQVEDDRSVLEGGGAVRTNLELLRRAREQAPDAYILYKPHPDVEAGHRIGSVPDDVALTLADEIVRDVSISSLIDMVDEVHVNTSLAGFEALMRGKAVTTHGVPFYAGWGLTRDLGPVPDRRTRRRTLDELIAAVLLIYPRYLDPETGLPCPPEILIQRLSQTSSHRKGSIVRLRRLQGRLKRLLATLRWR